MVNKVLIKHAWAILRNGSISLDVFWTKRRAIKDHTDARERTMIGDWYSYSLQRSYDTPQKLWRAEQRAGIVKAIKVNIVEATDET